ncbi:hypothetical protein L1049_002077 [Liquidambar formosana]|uniref:Protein FAR1-RELATED SEQUENCE n=1 Tax=Liquidambar formosana TaxID=63359 RepID=A0AAP0NIW0_LIQFO
MDSSEADISSCAHEENFENELQTLPGVDIDVGQDNQGPRESSFDKSRTDIDGERSQSPREFSVDKSHTDVDGKQSQNPKQSSLDKNRVDIDGELECQSPKVSSVNKCDLDIDSEQECQSPKVPCVDISESCCPVKDEANIDQVPSLGMEFESEEQAYKCYSRYAVLEGFSIRKDFVNKSRVNGAVVSRRFTCFRQGYRPSKREANVRKPRQETRTGCLAHMTIARQPNGKFRVTHFENEHNHEFVTACTAHTLPSQKRLTFAQAVEADLSSSSVMEDGVPKLGMGFDSEDHAYEFYNAYAGRVGFSVRKDYVNRSKIDGGVASRRFTCFREGFRQKDKRDLNVKRPRKETRIGCLAQLVIARQPDGKYRVTHFEEKHNHELVAACRVRMLRSQKRLAAAQVVEGNVADGSMIEPKSAPELICIPAGEQENFGYNPIDYKSKLPCKRMREMRDGDTDSLLQYFQSKQLKNPSFVYAIQLDAEDQITNIFWADAKMVVDYSDFGDVVCFDTTYRLNKDCRPFAPFIGVNHHKQMVIFGAALLYDETVESFKWLFRTFIEAMSGKKPKTILTDQDAILAEAIDLVLPEAHHRICVWHVYQNALNHLGHIFEGSSSFANDLSSCIFDHEEEEDFINAWKVMLDIYGLWENEWLHEIFKDREKWATAYERHIFCADIKNTLLCESFHANLRKYLKSDLNVLQFLKHLGKVVNDWHYKELEVNYDMGQHMPKLMGDVILLKRARDVYTPKIFELFQQEYEKCLNVVVNQCTEKGSLFEYKVSIYGQVREYTVIYNSSDNTVVCSCMKFEFMGFLCSHALKVLDYRNIKVVPLHYVLKRWTKDARI